MLLVGRSQRVLDLFDLDIVRIAHHHILRLVARPEGQVVAQQLHDERAVFVRVLAERVELSDGVVECLVGGGVGR